MSAESKAVQLITKLLRETLSGEVKWVVKDPPLSLREATEKVIPLYLQTEYKGTLVGLYEKRFKYYFDEHDFNWSESIGFCIVDEKGRVLWEAGEVSPALIDLFETAREQASGIDDILDGLLND